MNIKKRFGKNEKGAVAIYTALFLLGFLGIAALGIDVNYLYGVRNELQNAADAGALAGAGSLFDPDDGALTRDAAIAEATRIAIANKTGTEAVVAKTVQTGHWSFRDKNFTANAATTQTEWVGQSFKDLDKNTDFINAVRVHTERAKTPSFFARIFGIADSLVAADAVAYVGFPGKFQVDQPIAICLQSIVDPSGNYNCNMGRMINSGGTAATSNTGSWTNFTQPCETATPPTVNPLICAGKSTMLDASLPGIGTSGGETSAPKEMIDCWAGQTSKIKNFNMTLPVIDCPKNNVPPCSKLVGAVNVDLIWIIEKEDPKYNDAPTQMTIYDKDGNITDSWSNSDLDGFTRWKDFVDHFHIENVTGPPSDDNDYQDYKDMYQKKNMIFLPSCEVIKATGGPGGEVFNTLTTPVLVE